MVAVKKRLDPLTLRQARQFLSSEETEVVKLPFVMDVFFLDVLCEMLSSPLYFLSYINRRTCYSDKVYASNELIILGYHLKKNLWLEERDSLHLDDSLSTDLDIAMMVRRTGVSGADTPAGILTKLDASPVKKLLKQIEHLEEPATIDLGFLMLSLNGETLDELGANMEKLIRKAKIQNNHHDITIGVGDSGITMHFNVYDDLVAAEKLRSYCEKRKYVCKANSWFGICINPKTSQLRFGIELVYPWEQSDTMDKFTEGMSAGNTWPRAHSVPVKRKVGRNDPCVCGSEKKFKKCCLGK